MTARLTFTIDLSSDYHIGAGHGLGTAIDSALHRDPDGVPVIRGSTLSGLMRDGLLRLLQLPAFADDCRLCSFAELGGGAPHCPGDQVAPCTVCVQFGSPARAGRWSIGSARPVQAAVPLMPARHWTAGEAAAGAAHVRVDPRTRRAADRKLFVEEDGDRALTFSFSATYDGPAADFDQDAEWLVAAARAVRELGAGRRRGRGACRLRLTGIEPALDDAQTAVLERFRRRRLGKHVPVVPVATPSFEPVHGFAKAKENTIHARLVLRLDEPMIVAARPEAGNEYHGAELVPGTTLRGAMAAKVARRFDLSDASSPAYAAFIRLFVNGGLRIDPLYPARLDHPVLQPAIPRPLDLLECEMKPAFHGHWQPHPAVAAARTSPPPLVCTACAEGGDDSRLAGNAGWLVLSHQVRSLGVRRTTEMHVRIDPRSGRAAEGALYGYDAVAPGQYFVGEVSASGADWEEFLALTGLAMGTPFALRLGRATRRGYGGAMACLSARPEGAAHIWSQRSLTERVSADGGPMTLTLLTDTILPDPWGRFRRRLDDSEWLSKLIGAPVTVLSSFVASHHADSFDAHLGLPRWRDIAIVAGSAVGFLIHGERDLARLESLEEHGIGLRCAEGFGRVVFNHPVYDLGVEAPESIQLPEALELGQETAPFARNRRAWAAFLRDDADMAKFRHEATATLAKLLLTEMPPNMAAASDLLRTVGRVDRVVPPVLLADDLAVWGASKSGDQRRRFRYRSGRGAEIDLIQLLSHALTELDVQTRTQPAFWPIGLRMLADAMAAEVPKTELYALDGAAAKES